MYRYLKLRDYFFKSFSLVCRTDETGDGRCTSVNKPSRLFHTWGAIRNHLHRCYLNVINVIKGCLFVWYEEAGSLSALITLTHYLQSAQTCISLWVPLMLGRIFKLASEVWKTTMQTGEQTFWFLFSYRLANCFKCSLLLICLELVPVTLLWIWFPCRLK